MAKPQPRQKRATGSARREPLGLDKSQFLANIGHELRTPLSGVMGLVGILLDGELSPVQREQASAAMASADHLLRLLDQAMEFHQLEYEIPEFTALPLAFAKIIADIDSTFAPLAAAKDLKLVIRSALAKDLVLGDSVRLHQVMAILLGNAIKFSDKGCVTLTLNCVAETHKHQTLRFTVQDEGSGVALRARLSLFRAFIQGDAASTRRHGGVGLGLALAKLLVERMGGDIGVDSIEGTGSQFWFEVRLKKMSLPETPGLTAGPGRAVSGSQSSRILIAEDHPLNQKITLTTVRYLGYTADAVSNGREALAALAKQRYDLVLMDCQMPEMDGLQTTAAIRAMPDRLQARTPIIALTANALGEDRDKCLAVGMDDFLAKPAKSQQLAAVIAKWLSRGDSK